MTGVMLQRILTFLAVAVVLTGLLLYSQWDREPEAVSGIVEADEIRVGSQVGGRVKAVRVEEGDEVSAGELLIELEPFDLQARRAEAVAQLAAAEAEFARLKAGFRQEEIEQARAKRAQLAARYEKLERGPRSQEIEAARGRLEVAEAELRLAKQNFERVKQVFERNAATEEQMDQATERLNAALAEKLVREQELALLEEGTREEEIAEAQAALQEAEQVLELREAGFREEEIANAKAKVEAAEASLKAIDARLDELKIVAPVEGLIEALELQPGDLVSPGAPVLSLMDTGRLWIRAYVPINQQGVAVGQKVPVHIDSFPDATLTGEITFISRQHEFTPNNVQTPEERRKLVYRMKVALPSGAVSESGVRIRPGMTGDVELQPLSSDEGER